MRFAFISVLFGLAAAYLDLQTHNAASPSEVVEFAIESAVSGGRSIDARRAESRSLAELAARRNAARRNLEALLSSERMNAALLEGLV